MADPLAAFCEVNQERFDALIENLGSYQPQAVDLVRIRRWVRQFDAADYDLAIRVVENVVFYDLTRLQRLLRTLHREIRTLLAEEGYRQLENLIFVPIGVTAESGQVIAAMYRNINRLQQSNARFAQVVELQGVLYNAQTAGEKVALVFLDDFIGTGLTVTDFWKDVLSQHVYPTQPMFLGTAVACQDGINKIEAETPLRVIAVHLVQNMHLLPHSDRFSAPEKQQIELYCRQVGNPPLGIGGLGLMLAFAHGCPNNVLAILRGSKAQRHWKGILPRFDDLP